MKKLLCVLMLGMVFGQAELTTRVYDYSYNYQDLKNFQIYISIQSKMNKYVVFLLK